MRGGKKAVEKEKEKEKGGKREEGGKGRREGWKNIERASLSVCLMQE